jgi:hypothetical protein
VSAPRKSWDDHSDRWKRQAKREGLTPGRWNRWLRLSPKTRKETNPREYAKGESVPRQRRTKLEKGVIERLNQFRGIRKSTVQHNVESLADKDLKWLNNAPVDDIRERAGRKRFSGTSNPWFYGQGA